MRPGLVAVGGALVLLGGGILASVYLVPTPGPTNQYAFSDPVQVVRAHATWSVLLNGINDSGASVTVRWSSSQSLAGSLYTHLTCTPSVPPCPGPKLLAQWTSGVSGVWTAPGPSSFPYRLNLTNAGSAPANATVAWSETIPSAFHLPALTALLVDAGSATLMGIGGVAVFLGLFLRGGVYRRPPAPSNSRPGEDAESLTVSPDLRPPRD